MNLSNKIHQHFLEPGTGKICMQIPLFSSSKSLFRNFRKTLMRKWTICIVFFLANKFRFKSFFHILKEIKNFHVIISMMNDGCRCREIHCTFHHHQTYQIRCLMMVMMMMTTNRSIWLIDTYVYLKEDYRSENKISFCFHVYLGKEDNDILMNIIQ